MMEEPSPLHAAATTCCCQTYRHQDEVLGGPVWKEIPCWHPWRERVLLGSGLLPCPTRQRHGAQWHSHHVPGRWLRQGLPALLQCCICTGKL